MPYDTINKTRLSHSREEYLHTVSCLTYVDGNQDIPIVEVEILNTFSFKVTWNRLLPLLTKPFSPFFSYLLRPKIDFFTSSLRSAFLSFVIYVLRLGLMNDE